VDCNSNEEEVLHGLVDEMTRRHSSLSPALMRAVHAAASCRFVSSYPYFLQNYHLALFRDRPDHVATDDGPAAMLD